MASVDLTKIGSRVRHLLGEVRERLPAARSGNPERQGRRWLAVTVEGDPTQITSRDRLPAPLAELGDRVELEVRPGPGDWGTEIFARPAPPSSSSAGDPDLGDQIRSALRQTKQLLEVGEVLVAEPRPEGRRPTTVAGKLVDHAERTADEKGVL